MLLGARVGRPCLKCSGRKLVLVTVSSAGIDSEMEERIPGHSGQPFSTHGNTRGERSYMYTYLGRSCYSIVPTCLNSWQDQ